MKKTYMQPQVAVDQLETEMLIAESLQFDSSKKVTGNDDIGTKNEGSWNIWE